MMSDITAGKHAGRARLSPVIPFLFVLLLTLCGCASVERAEGPSAVAVFDLEDMSLEAGAAPPGIGQMLSGQIMEAVRKKGVQVVERQRILTILEELNLGSSALADEGTRLRIGRIVGAGRMVFGGFQVMNGAMRIDLRLVDVETGRVLRACAKTVVNADMGGWLNAASQAAEELFD